MQDIDAKRYFNEAVDAEALGIPEYRNIIKVNVVFVTTRRMDGLQEPMDLGLVFWKLKDQTYKDLTSFFADLHLVCLTHTFNERVVVTPVTS